jgi:predicted HAD superfamily hydrolase
LSYWAHSWLGNKPIGHQLNSKFHVNSDLSSYLDSPVGTMFWARTDALRPILSSGFTIEDFPEESGQKDGTLAHAMERMLVPVALRQGYTFCEINMERKDFSVSFGSRNLFQYWAKSLNDLKSAIRQHNLISFDIFDTLITRPLLDPDSAFDLLSIEVECNEGIKNFREIRKTAEAEIRSEKGFGSDVGIDEIYKHIGSKLKLDKVAIDRLCSMERDIELRLNLPRSEVIEAFRFAREKGKRVVLMSDMYLDEVTVRALLAKNGIEGYDELCLSSSMGVRKDSAGMWLKLLERHPGVSILHIGDNEHSDVQIPHDMGISNYHVMSPKNIFNNSLIGREFQTHTVSQNIADSALLGVSVNYLFNNPFGMHDCKGDYIFSDKFSLGYAVIGPVIFAYLSWLLRTSIKDNVSKILFLAREGYLLKQIFDMIRAHTGVTNRPNLKIESFYLLASRRATMVPAIYNMEDALVLLKRHYNGKLYNLMEARFGLDQIYLKNKGVNNVYVELPNDLQQVTAVVREHFDAIGATALEERECYLKYLENIGIKGAKGGVAISDLGYSGNIQKALSKLLGTSLRGYYFATCFDVEDDDKLGNKFQGFFTENDNPMITESAVYRYSLVLESILTSPDGQLAFFEDSSGKVLPVFGKPNDQFNDLKKIHEGITAYCCDMLQYFGRYLLDFEPDRKVVEYLLGKVISENRVDQKILSQLKVENKYCSDGDIGAL